jgi:hypothetical protein
VQRVIGTCAACVATAGLLAGCGALSTRSASDEDVAAAARADALAGVAQRLYVQEADGIPARAAVKRIARDRALVAALASGNRAVEHRAADRQLFDKGKHVVRLRVVRRGHDLVDVGGAFVVAGAQRELRTPAGGHLGTLQASIQDVIGYVKLYRRLTRASIVVRGRPGHVVAAPAITASMDLPASGRVSVGGKPFVVRSFVETGYAGEPLRVWVLVAA